MADEGKRLAITDPKSGEIVRVRWYSQDDPTEDDINSILSSRPKGEQFKPLGSSDVARPSIPNTLQSILSAGTRGTESAWNKVKGSAESVGQFDNVAGAGARAIGSAMSGLETMGRSSEGSTLQRLIRGGADVGLGAIGTLSAPFSALPPAVNEAYGKTVETGRNLVIGAATHAGNPQSIFLKALYQTLSPKDKARVDQSIDLGLQVGIGSLLHGVMKPKVEPMKPVEVIPEAPPPEAIPEAVKPVETVQPEPPVVSGNLLEQTKEAPVVPEVAPISPELKPYSINGKHEFNYIHNTEKAPKPGVGDTFGQKIEPAGKYMNLLTPEGAKGNIEHAQKNSIKNWEIGTVSFDNPLIVQSDGTSINWKRELSKTYGGKTGKKLSDAIRKDGYDAVITIDKGQPSEVVSLKSPSAPIEPERVQSVPVVGDENHIISKPLSESPKPIAEAIQNRADEMSAEVNGFTNELVGSHLKNAGRIKSEMDIVGQSKGGQINTYPDWWKELGANKERVLGALEKIKKDAGEDKGVLVEKLKGVIHDELSNGGQRPEGFIPPDELYGSMVDAWKGGKLDEFIAQQGNTDFNFGANLEPKKFDKTPAGDQANMFGGDPNAAAKYPEHRVKTGEDIGAEGSPLFTKEAPPSNQGDVFDSKAAHSSSGMPKEMDAAGGKPTTINDIRQHFEKSLGVPIRTGKYNTRAMGSKAAGIFDPHADVVRLKDYGDIETLSHEIAHVIDKRYDLRATELGKYADELKPLDYDQKKGRPYEGFAEWMRHYITGSGDAQALAPKFTKAFETLLEQHPELKQTIEGGKKLFDSWRSQGAEARVKAAIVYTPEKTPLGIGIQNVKNFMLREFDDALTPLRHFNEAAEKSAGKKLRGTENAFDLATAIKGTAPAKAHNWINEQTSDFNGSITGEGLTTIFKKVVGKEESAIEYAYAKHGVERWKEGKNPGSDLADLQYILDKNKSPEFEQFSKDLSEYRDRLLQYVVDAGAFDPETAALFRETYKSSIPLYREGFETGGGGGTKYANLSNPMKRAKGSGRMVVNPVAGLMKETERLIGFGDRARVGSAIAEAVDKYPDLGLWAEKIALPAKSTKLSSAQVVENFKKAGIDLGNLDTKALDKLLTSWSQQVRGIPNENIVTFYKNGELKAYQLNKELFDGIAQVNPWSAEGFFKLLTFPKKFVTAGATGYRASFGLLTNALRDPWTAMMQSQLGKTTPFSALGGTLKVAAHRLGLRAGTPDANGIELWKRVGGEQATFFNSELPRAMDNAKRIIADNGLSATMKVVKHPVELYREILGTPEAGPRSAEFTGVYDRILKETGDPSTAWIEALNASKNVTMNFGRAGRTAAIINQFVPFFNPSLQEPGLIVRTFRNAPVKTMVKGLVGVTIPTIALWNLNKDEDWYKATPTWEKAVFWHFRINETTWKLPKAFLWGGLFASWPESVLDSFYKHDPEIVKDMMKQIGSNIIPPLTPPFVSVPFALASGEGGFDYFRGRSIVPQSQVQNLPPSERYGKYTSKTAKALGGLLSASPSKIDYAIGGFTGGAGTDIIQAAEGLFSDKKSKGIENTPFIGRLVSRSPYINKFYDEAGNYQEKAKELKVKPKSEWTAEDKKNSQQDDRFDKISKELAGLRKRITQIGKSAVSNEAKSRSIESINKKMEDLAYKTIFRK